MRALTAHRTPPTPVRLTTRKLGRARVLLGRRPALLVELEDLRSAAAGALTGALGCEVRLTARMADAPIPPVRALGHAALFCVVALGGPGSEAVLELDPRLAAVLAAVRIGAPGPDVPVLTATRLERALLGELLLTILRALREKGQAESRWRPRLVEIGVARGEAERRLGSTPALVVEIGIEGPAVRGRAVLHLPELALCAVALSVAPGRAPPGAVMGEARLPFSPRIGCGVVWADELAGLSDGAAVALPRARVVDRSLCCPAALVRPGVSLSGDLESDGFHHVRAELRPPSQEVTHVDPALSELPVELEVELASIPLSLAELGALQPGAVLPLRVSPGDPVFLRAGDRRIARAELVEIEGEVAARVLGLVP